MIPNHVVSLFWGRKHGRGLELEGFTQRRVPDEFTGVNLPFCIVMVAAPVAALNNKD